MSPRHRRYAHPRTRRFVSSVLVGAAASLAVIAVGGVSPMSATAAGVLSCDGSVIYTVQRGSTSDARSNGTLLAMTASTVPGASPATVTTTVVSAIPAGGGVNGLGIAPGGVAAYAVNQIGVTGPTTPVYRYAAAAGTWTSHVGTATAGESYNAGAIDPLSGIYYYAAYVGATNTANVYGFDTTTDTAIPGRVAVIPLPLPGSSGGDMTFDSAGNLYLLESAGTSTAISRVDGPLPTTGSAAGAPLTGTTIATLENPGAVAYGGVAFDNAGRLYLQYNSAGTTFVQILNPNTGAIIAAGKPMSDNTFASVDLGVCSLSPTLTVQKNVVGRYASTDQFRLEATGGGLGDGNTATTTGTADGIQAAVAGPVIALTGTTYTITETATSGSLLDYTTTYECVDTANGGAVLASGGATTFTLPFPVAPVAGLSPNIVCTFTNTPVITSLALTKSVAETSLVAGGTLNYSFDVTNTGSVPLAPVTVAETAFNGSGTMSGIACPAGAADLAPGAGVTCTATYTVTQADVDAGTVDNTAVASGVSPAGTTIVSPESSAAVPETSDPAMTLVKSVTPATVTTAGETVAYSFDVTNTGDVTVASVAVAETAFSGSGPAPAVTCPPAAAALAPGATVTCTATYVVTQADLDMGVIDNTAVANGTAPSGAPVASEPSSAQVTAGPEPGLSLVKSAAPTTITEAGQTVTYSFVLTNTGNVTLTDVRPVEGGFSGTGTLSTPACPAAAASVAPGARVTCTATYTVTQADVDAGSVTNTATGTGIPPSGPPAVSPPSEVTVPLGGLNGLGALGLAKVAKAVDVNRNGRVDAGDRIDWTIVVSNLGVTTITGITVSDPTAGPVTCPATSLAPATRMTCTTRSHVITTADAARGRVDNTATVTGTGVDGPTPPARASAGVAVSRSPQLADTGVAGIPLLVHQGIGLVLVGGLLVLLGRRRTS